MLEVRRGSQPTTDDEPQFRQSDLVLNPKSDLALNQLESRELRQLGLEQQSRLLEKDRELARAGQQVSPFPLGWSPDFTISSSRCVRVSKRWNSCMQSLQILPRATGSILLKLCHPQMSALSHWFRAMMGIVEEFEKTISQLISEKERESVCNVITRERSTEANYAII